MSERTTREGRAKRSFNVIVITVLVGLVVLFTLQNLEVVQVNFLFWSFALRRSILIFVVLLIGGASGWTLRSIHGRGHAVGR